MLIPIPLWEPYLDNTRTLRNTVCMGQIRQEIPDDLHRWLKVQAAEAGIPLKDYLIQLIERAKEEQS